MRRLALLAFLLAVLMPSVALAVTPDEMLKNPVLEARARHISSELRCMVCQNESIDDSAAPLAHDIRVLVRQRLVAGDTDQQVIDYLVARYGQFILLKPPFEWGTVLLWGAPPAALLFGGIGIFLAARRRKAGTPEPAELTSGEAQRLAKLVEPQID